MAESEFDAEFWKNLRILAVSAIFSQKLVIFLKILPKRTKYWKHFILYHFATPNLILRSNLESFENFSSSSHFFVKNCHLGDRA